VIQASLIEFFFYKKRFNSFVFDKLTKYYMNNPCYEYFKRNQIYPSCENRDITYIKMKDKKNTCTGSYDVLIFTS